MRPLRASRARITLPWLLRRTIALGVWGYACLLLLSVLADYPRMLHGVVHSPYWRFGHDEHVWLVVAERLWLFAVATLLALATLKGPGAVWRHAIRPFVAALLGGWLLVSSVLLTVSWRRVAASSSEANLRIGPPPKYFGDVFGFTWSPNGGQIAVAALNRVQLWEFNTGRKLREIDLERGLMHASFLHWTDGSLLYRSGSFYAFETAHGTVAPKLDHYSTAATAWNRKRSVLAMADDSGSVEIRRLPSFDSDARFQAGTPKALTWNGGGTELASCQANGQIEVWASQKRSMRTLQTHAPIEACAWNPRRDVLATGGKQASIGIWDIAHGRLRSTLLTAAAVAALAWSDDGRFLASLDERGTLVIWSGDSLRRVRELSINGPPVALQWRPGSGHVLAAATYHSVQVFDRARAAPTLVIVSEPTAWLSFKPGDPHFVGSERATDLPVAVHFEKLPEEEFPLVDYRDALEVSALPPRPVATPMRPSLRHDLNRTIARHFLALGCAMSAWLICCAVYYRRQVVPTAARTAKAVWAFWTTQPISGVGAHPAGRSAEKPSGAPRSGETSDVAPYIAGGQRPGLKLLRYPLLAGRALLGSITLSLGLICALFTVFSFGRAVHGLLFGPLLTPPGIAAIFANRDILELFDNTSVRRDGSTGLVSSCLVILFLWTTLWIAESRKRVVLYLRPFRVPASSSFMSWIVQHGLGRGFRIVTLDDNEFPSLEVPRLEKLVSWIFLPVTMSLVAYFSLGISASQWRQEVAQAMFVLVFSASFLIVFGFCFVLLHRWRIRSLARLRVANEGECHLLLARIATLRSRVNSPGFMAPQATVVSVAAAAWQAAVSSCLQDIDSVVIDVSVPTVNIAWEIELVAATPRLQVAYIAEESAFRESRWESVLPETSLSRLRGLLADDLVLFYNSSSYSRVQSRRFRAALQRALERRPSPAGGLRRLGNERLGRRRDLAMTARFYTGVAGAAFLVGVIAAATVADVITKINGAASALVWRFR